METCGLGDENLSVERGWLLAGEVRGEGGGGNRGEVKQVRAARGPMACIC